MIDQLDIFSLPIQEPCELPEVVPQNIDPQIEEAIAALQELKELSRSEFQIGTRIICGGLRGEIVEIVDQMLCNVHFDRELKSRPAFLDYLRLEDAPAPVLVEGCTVRSSTSFKKQTGKLIRFEEIAGIKFAIVEYLFNGSNIQYPCTIATLEVIECN